MNDNNLILNTSQSATFFRLLQNLLFLSLDTIINCSDEIFVHLTSLEKLTVDRQEYVMFGESFLSMTKLTSLGIYGKFRIIQNTALENLSSSPIIEFKIKSENTLSTIEPEAFAQLRRLEVLDLSYNRGIGFDGVSKAWYGLNETKIKTLILTRIISDDDVGPQITSSFYQYLNYCKIETLLIDRNNIVEVDEGMAKDFSHLQHVDFSYNRLSNVANLVYEMALLKYLRYADFRLLN